MILRCGILFRDNYGACTSKDLTETSEHINIKTENARYKNQEYRISVPKPSLPNQKDTSGTT